MGRSCCDGIATYKTGDRNKRKGKLLADKGKRQKQDERGKNIGPSPEEKGYTLTWQRDAVGMQGMT